MIHHIVFWKMKPTAEGHTGAENALEMARRLQTLPPMIPQVKSLFAGPDFNRSGAAWDIALETTFASRADLDTYQNHPEHVKVGVFIKAVVAERSVVDFES